MNSTPTVSVLTTAFNREAFLTDAIESVLASSFTDFELIIVDDCSTDNTVELAKSYEAKDKRVKVYVNEKNIGDYPNRNKAASYAKGTYIKYLDSDDTIYPHGLEVMVNAMGQFPEAGFGLASKPDGDHPFPSMILPERIYWEHFNGYSHFDRAPGSLIILLSAFKKMNGFSGERMVGDLEFWLRIARYYPMVKFQFDLYWNRLHKGQEFQTDYAKSVYRRRTKGLINDALHHKDCPLTGEAKSIIKQKLKRDRLKNKVLTGLFSVKKIIDPGNQDHKISN